MKNFSKTSRISRTVSGAFFLLIGGIFCSGAWFAYEDATSEDVIESVEGAFIVDVVIILGIGLAFCGIGLWLLLNKQEDAIEQIQNHKIKKKGDQ